MDFRQTIRDFARGAAAILEIGPSYNPITPKSEGFHVTIMDHASQEELRRKYQNHYVDLNRIEEVDVIGTSLELLIGRKFSCIIASHVIEHTTDLVRFIQNCSRLLEDGGRLFLIVPDKRYCFDYHRPLTPTGQILDAYLSKKTRHDGAVFDLLVSAVNRGGVAWSADTEEPFKRVHTFEEAAAGFMNAVQSSEYTDAHEWTFTPSSFRLIVQDLGRLGLIDLFEADFHPSAGFEFFISLTRQRPLKQVPRTELEAALEGELISASEEYRALQRELRSASEEHRALQRELRSANDEHRALQRRIQELEARVAETEPIMAAIRELRARFDAWVPDRSAPVRRAARLVRSLLQQARTR